MKWLSDRCRRHRQNLCLLASGLLSGPEKADIENHLVECASCRKYYAGIKPITAPLADWERNFASLEPAPDVKMRWVDAIQEADKSNSARTFSPGSIVWNIGYELFWPSRHIWAGLAAVWVLILAANVSMRANSQTVVSQYSPTPEMISSFRQQEKILAELIGPNEPRAARPPKVLPPQPSSERRFEIMAT
jgi:hypothetical protein